MSWSGCSAGGELKRGCLRLTRSYNPEKVLQLVLGGCCTPPPWGADAFKCLQRLQGEPEGPEPEGTLAPLPAAACCSGGR